MTRQRSGPPGTSGRVRVTVAMGDARHRLRDCQYRMRPSDQVDRFQLAGTDNAAPAPGRICERCEQVIAADEEVRRRAGGWWMHEACPGAQ